MENEYYFKSERLGFRNWNNQDLKAFESMNSDPAVMKYFPATLNEKESQDLLKRLKRHQSKFGYTYFATDILNTDEFIGFIGLQYKDYKAFFNPSVDIGWRLKKEVWGKGYATEGAKRCLEYAFRTLNLNRIISVCPEINKSSERIMNKIGMKKIGEFEHPQLIEYPTLQNCVCYEMNVDDFQLLKDFKN